VAQLSTTIARLRAALGRPELRRAAGNTGWLLADRLLRLVGGVLVGLWVARHLGPAGFGALNFALALSVIVTSLATLGLDSILVRELVRGPAAEPRLLGSALLLRLAGGLAAQLLIVALAALLRPGDTLTLALTAIVGLGGVLQAFLVIDLWFQARVQSRAAVLARATAFLAAVLLRVALILSAAPLPAFAWAYVAEWLLGALLLLTAYRRHGGRPLAWRPSRTLLRALLADSWPLIFAGLLVNLYLRIDQVMIGQLLGNAELGVYSAAVRLAEVLPLLPGAIIASTLPAIVAAREAAPLAYADRLQRLYALVAAIGYAAAIGATLAAAPLVTLLLGPGYEAATPQIIVLAWAGVFVGLGMARSSFLTAENLTRLHLMTVAIGCAANVLLNWLLIPRIGGLGAAVASLVAYWLAAHGSCFLFPPLRPAGWAITRALLLPKFWP
jgi:O-antigen/teichoic acid export membrane protein